MRHIQVLKIEWNVCVSLGDQNYFATKRVCDTNLVEDIRIPACAVTDDDTGPVNE